MANTARPDSQMDRSAGDTIGSLEATLCFLPVMKVTRNPYLRAIQSDTVSGQMK
jgi:hypothetical protein